jgi:hypothetical protein
VRPHWDTPRFVAWRIMRSAGSRPWGERSFSRAEHHTICRLMQLPPVYYNQNGLRTKYSLVFDEHLRQVLIWHWDARLFRGSLRACHHYVQAWAREQGTSRTARQ